MLKAQSLGDIIKRVVASTNVSNDLLPSDSLSDNLKAGRIMDVLRA